MASPTVENYVKSVFKLAEGQEGHRVTTGQLAAAMEVSPGTVTSMLKTLSEQGLATYTPYEGVRLSETGESLAFALMRKHLLIVLFFSKILNVDASEVQDDATRMEHVISDRLIGQMDAYLEHPQFQIGPEHTPVSST
jgi:DtxR family Mn-dependent transcriptional regulator